MSTDTCNNDTDATLNEHATELVQTGPGARFRNRSNLRHGLTSGTLPQGAGYVQSLTNRLRRSLEDAVVERHGEVSLPRAAAINTSIKWERHGLLCLRWLRLKQDQLTPDQLLAFSRDYAKASSERDKCIQALDLDFADSHRIVDAMFSSHEDNST